MFDWLVEKILKNYVKKLLDKLPLNGKKTLLSLVVLIVAVAAQMLPQFAELMQPISDFALSLGAEDFRNAGIVGVIVGLLHKFLKKD